MDLNRRDFMRLSGFVASATAMPTNAKMIVKPRSKNIVLTTGLSSDLSFVEGVNANLQVVTLTNTTVYSDLLTQLTTTKDRALFALVKPADAVLLEQALRDSYKRKFISQSVKAPRQEEDNWAFTLGQQLAAGNQLVSSQSQRGLPLVAIRAHL